LSSNSCEEKLTYLDPFTNKTLTPHVIEPSYGADRLTLAILLDAYHEEKLTEDDTRVVMKFKTNLAPITVAILPLVNKLNEQAEKIAQDLIKFFRVDFDTSGTIGKRYRRQDEIGTPFCLTFDFESLEDQAVTIRDRDTMKQERIKISELKTYLQNKLAN
jgi:glycyl-tRNA synthetase